MTRNDLSHLYKGSKYFATFTQKDEIGGEIKVLRKEGVIKRLKGSNLVE